MHVYTNTHVVFLAGGFDKFKRIGRTIFSIAKHKRATRMREKEMTSKTNINKQRTRRNKKLRLLGKKDE